MHKGGWGGQPNRILLVSKALMERGHYVIVAAPKGATLIKRAKSLGIPVFDDLKFPKKFSPKTFCQEVLKLRKLMEKENIHIVHTHGSQDTWTASIAAKLFNPPKPVVRTRHNTFFVENHVANRFLYRVLIDYLVLVSEGILDVYKRSGVLGNKIEKTKTVYSVVESERFKDAKNMKRNVISEFKISEKFPVFVKVARLAKEKGHIHFLKVAKEFLSVSKALFFALGEGPLKEYLEKFSSDLGIKEYIFFTGLRSDVPGFLSIADLFLFTPVSGESLGTAALEALYTKVPVCAFKVGGIDASVEEGKSGFLLPVGDEDGMFEKMKIVFNRRRLRIMGFNGRRIINRKFLLPVLVEGNLWVYQKILKR